MSSARNCIHLNFFKYSPTIIVKYKHLHYTDVETEVQ